MFNAVATSVWSGPRVLLVQRQGALQQRLSRRIVTSFLENQGEIVERLGMVRMIGAQPPHGWSARAKHRFGRGEISLGK